MLRKFFFSFILITVIISAQATLQAQIKYKGFKQKAEEINYGMPQEYQIGAINISGHEHLDPVAVSSISGLKVGDRIKVPGPQITQAMNDLWEYGLMEEVMINVDSINEGKVFLTIQIKESPRLAGLDFTGVSKGDASRLTDEVDLVMGKIINNAMIKNAELVVLNYYREKGFKDVEVKTTRVADNDEFNTARLKFEVKKNSRLKLSMIYLKGNASFSSRKLKKQMHGVKEQPRFHPFTGKAKNEIGEEKGLKPWIHRAFYFNIFGNSKYRKAVIDDDIQSIESFYRKMGYRNASVISDSLVISKGNKASLYVEIEEGKQFYIRNILWTGNYKYSDDALSKILGMGKGDVYSLEILQQRLNFNPEGLDVSSLYVDNGFLMFTVQPVELTIENDSVDLELRVSEGREFTVRKVEIKGNNVTNDYVLRRELRTLPGQRFSRTDVVRSTQELASLGFLEPQGINVDPVLNPAEGTVDLIYNVEEQSGTEFQASMGFGQNARFFGTLGIALNNFSAKNFFRFSEWKGLPVGDGQKLQISAQSNGGTFQNYALSFADPWFGGKKHNTLSFSFNHVVTQRYNLELEDLGNLKLYSATLGLAKRLKWPDDFFQIQHAVNYSYYKFQDYGNGLGINNGDAHSLTWNTTFSRYSLDNPMFPRQGSNLSLKISLTPPYSLLSGKDYDRMEKAEKFRLVEYHKYEFDASFFTPVIGDLVFHAKASMGFIGSYSSALGIGPFERYSLGGTGMGSTGDYLVGNQPIGLRGFEENAITPVDQHTGFSGGVVFNKFTFELRYPISQSPLIYALGFMEAANTWNNYRSFNPNQLFKTVGVGFRINLPGMGMIGIDYGHVLDDTINSVSPVKKNFTFTMGMPRR